MEENRNEEIQEEVQENPEVVEEVSGDDKASLEEKLKECEDRYLRTHADFENVKKRLEREKYQLLEYAYEKFAKDLLPVIDSLEMAMQSSKNEQLDSKELLEKLQEGIGLTLENFAKAFNKHGIDLIECEGEFDPHLHDAVMQVASEEHDEGQIVQLLQKGYKYKERVLRPSMVSICKK